MSVSYKQTGGKMSKNKGSNKENFEKTSKKFLEIARKEFIEYGYVQASTERIVEKSGMARGSLYYHYGNKEGIFRAVYQQVVEEFGERISDLLKDEKDPLIALKKGCRFFYEECRRKDVRVIMLIEGIANIPYFERLKILEKHMIIHIRTLIEAIQEQEMFKEFNGQVIMLFIYGMLAEAGRSIEYMGDIDENIKHFSDNIEIAIDKLAS